MRLTFLHINIYYVFNMTFSMLLLLLLLLCKYVMNLQAAHSESQTNLGHLESVVGRWEEETGQVAQWLEGARTTITATPPTLLEEQIQQHVVGTLCVSK